MLLNEIAMTRHERGQILKIKTQLEVLTAQNAKYRESLEKLATCEDESSWGDWAREIARDALEGK